MSTTELPYFVSDEISDENDPRVVYDTLTPRQAWASWPCAHCRIRRVEHAEQPDRLPLAPELYIRGHLFEPARKAATMATPEEIVRFALSELAGRLDADVLEKAWRQVIAEQVRRHCTPSTEAYTRGGDFMIRAVADWIENPPGWVQEIIEEQTTRNEPAPEPKIEGKTEPEPRRFAIRRALEALVKAADPELDFKLVNEIHVEPRALTIHRFMTNAEALTPEEIEEEGVDPAARAQFGMIASRAYRFSPILPKEES